MRTNCHYHWRTQTLMLSHYYISMLILSVQTRGKGELENERERWDGQRWDQTAAAYMGWTCTVLYCSVQCPHYTLAHWLTPTPGHQLPVIENRWGKISEEHHHQVPWSGEWWHSDMFKWGAVSVVSVLLWLRLGYKNKRSESESVDVRGWAFLSQADTDSAGLEIVITEINTIRT